MNRYFTIKFSDLEPDVRDSIRSNLEQALHEDTELIDRLKEQVGADPYDIDHYNTDMMIEIIESIVERACNRAWVEMELECKY
jgi:hypothetical protein